MKCKINLELDAEKFKKDARRVKGYIQIFRTYKDHSHYVWSDDISKKLHIKGSLMNTIIKYLCESKNLAYLQAYAGYPFPVIGVRTREDPFKRDLELK